MYRVVFLGPPGSGKGSQAKFVTERHALEHISTGDLLRAAVKAKTELGEKAAGIMSAGDLVPDELVLAMMGEHFDQMDPSSGFILDGFPRSIRQAEVLQEMLAERNRPLSFVLHLDVDFEVVVKRLSGRRTCANCGEIYNIYYKPTKQEGVCDACGHDELLHRADDNEESIRQRLEVYDGQTKPLLSFYEELDLLRTVEGTGSVADIADSVKGVFDSHAA